jgi:hypothetical protein
MDGVHEEESVMRARIAVLSVCSLVALVLCGCAPPPVTSTPAPAPPPPGSTAKTGALKAGVTELGDGRVVANGWVAYEDLEGGFWAVMDIAPSTSSVVQPKIVAVLLPGKVTLEELKNVEGTFVGAEGVLQTGASIRMAGPEVVVDALRVY